ncbi:MAG TPA: ABC transporter permease subunit [Ktedonobacteraceae bacterium]|nr:ABC transporter permease subunit [Ktedonobacteraceae bacterium]
MSAVITSTTTGNLKLRTAKPSFFGLVRGEFLKVMRQWTTWILLVLVAGVTILPYIIETVRPHFKADLTSTPLVALYDQMGIGLSVLRVFTGFFLLIVTARMVGQEYQLGTIRVLLSRGVGRLQLLFAKLLTMTIIALILLIVGILVNLLLNIILIAGIAGNLNSLSALTSQFWSDSGIYVLYVLLNMGVSILLATAMAVIGRASVFGIAAALAFFPLDNFGTVIMLLANRVTHSDFWLSITAYFLGPNLNQMPTALTGNRATSIGFGPLQTTDLSGSHGILVDGTHTLVVAAVYAAIFAAVAIWLTWKRDVKE